MGTVVAVCIIIATVVAAAGAAVATCRWIRNWIQARRDKKRLEEENMASIKRQLALLEEWATAKTRRRGWFW
jgi:hypothetical protein